jgi:probable F420-dependent oxidoreductase
MRELVLAIRAIWDTWLNGTPLAFRGEFFTHTLMTPFFSPPAAEIRGYGLPRIYVAGVGELMTEVAGEVADGFICHGFSTERYLREVTVPAIERGRRRSTNHNVEVVGTGFVVTGRDEVELEASVEATRRQLAFYASTPAYKPVLDLHGWGDLHGELNAMTKRGEWDGMGALIDDEMLDAFAVVGAPDVCAAKLVSRYGDVFQRLVLHSARRADPHAWAPVLDALRGA